jgi:hypothetical protein
MPPKSKNAKVVDVKPEDVGDISSDDDDTGSAPVVLEKPKRPRSEAQIAAFEKAKETKRLNFLKRKGLEDKKEEEIQKLVMQKQEKKAKKQKKLKELEVFNEPEEESEEEEEAPPVIIKKKVKKQTKAKVIYVDSDDEEVEKPIDKNIIIINKMHPQLSHSKPKMVKEPPSFVFL